MFSHTLLYMATPSRWSVGQWPHPNSLGYGIRGRFGMLDWRGGVRRGRFAGSRINGRMQSAGPHPLYGITQCRIDMISASQF